MIRRHFSLAVFAALALGQPGAAQWQSIGLSSGAGVVAIAADGTLYAGTASGVYRRNPSTLAWEPRSSGLGDRIIPALVTDHGSPGTLYAGSVGGGTGLSGGVFKTVNGGLAWASASSGLGNLFVQALAVDPTSPGTIYAGTQVGLYKSTDAGGRWSPMNGGLSDTSIQSIAVDPLFTSTIYVGTFDGVFKSIDGGSSWRAINRGFRGEQMPYTAAEFAIDPTMASTIYLASFVPVSVPVGGGVYKSVNGGEDWVAVNNGELAPTAMSAILLDPRSPRTVYAARQTGGVVRTTDGGDRWTSLSGGLTHPVLGFAADRDMAGVIYAATSGGVFQLSAGAANNCSVGPDTLCLNGGRFKVQVNWRVPNQGMSGMGQAVPMTSDTGSFWFFSSNNVELVVKVVDGRAFNNKLWVFYGALSNVEYTITVTDTQTGATKTYVNPMGQLASVADTEAF